MAKKIRFPLNLAEDKQARDLTELREFFSLPEVLGYIADGKLVMWLTDRYETDLAEAISSLDSSDPDFEKKVCQVLGVECQDNSITLEDAQARNEKLTKLKEFTDDKTIWAEVDSVAFDQEDVYNLLDEDFTKIYLCGEKFIIPIAKEGLTYIGVNKPIVVISSKEVVDFQQKNLVLENVVFDEGYQSVVKSHQEQSSQKEQELQRREEEIQRREKEILQREEALERQQEEQLPLNNKITLNLSGTILAYKKETMLQFTQGVSFELHFVFDENSPDHFNLDIRNRQIGFLGTLDYSFENISRCTEKWVLHDLNVSLTEIYGGIVGIGAVKLLPMGPFPDFVLEKYHFVAY